MAYALMTFAMAVCLAGSIALNLRLYHYAKRYYSLGNLNNIDPLGSWYYPASVSEPPPVPSSRPRVLFYGDSRSVEWTPPDVAGVEFSNRGISGQTSTQVLMRFDIHAGPMSPSLAILQVGINDLKAIPLFPDRRDAIVRNCREGIAALVGRFRDLGADVIVTTIFPHGGIPIERRPFWSSSISEAIEEVNASIRGLATDGVRLLDAYAILEDRGRVRRELARDALHLNGRGYESLNRELAPMIRHWAWERGMGEVSRRCDAPGTPSGSRIAPGYDRLLEEWPGYP
jgi:lysophospholipase L1-like esterase